MNRVWTALLLLATVAVIGAVGFVLVHKEKVPHAGETPGISPSSSQSAGTASGSPAASGSASSGSASDSASASTAVKLSPSTRLAFLGDNWTKGEGVDNDAAKAFPALVGAALKVKISAIATDGGGYAKQGTDGKNYDDLVDKVAQVKPTAVVVTGGRNDASDDPGTLTDDAKSVFADLKSKLPDVKIIAVAPFWGDSDHPSDLTMVDDAVKAGVQAAGGTYLDLPDPIHDHSDWMADSANPNDDGNQAIASALAPQLQKLLA